MPGTRIPTVYHRRHERPGQGAGGLSVEEAMQGIRAGLDGGRHVIIPGFKAKLTYFCNRYFPDFIMNGVVDSIVRSVLARMNAGAG